MSSALSHRCRRHNALVGVELAAQMTAFLALGEALVSDDTTSLMINMTALVCCTTVGSGGLFDHLVAHLVLHLLLLVEFGRVGKSVHVTLRLLAQLVDRVGQELV